MGVIAASFVLGVVSAFDAPTRHSFLVEIIAREDLLNAIALNSGLWHIARFVGPVVAGTIVIHYGEGAVFLLNGISFFAIIYCITQMRIPGRVITNQAATMQGLSESYNYVRKNPAMRGLLLLAAGFGFFGFAYLPLLPLFAKEVLHTNVVGLGTLMSFGGLGALIAALGIAAFSRRVNRQKLLTLSAASFSLALGGFAAAKSFPAAMVMMTLTSWSGVSTMLLLNSLLQEMTPHHLRGRILSLYTLAIFGIGPLGGICLGTLIEIVGRIQLMIGLSAIVTAIIVAVVIRTLDVESALITEAT